MIFIIYAALVVCVVLFSIRLSHYVDLLDQKTTLASAFIGGVMLAAVTSLPELMTSITSVALVGKPEMVIGNILGSNLFNVTVLGLVFLIYCKGLRDARITRSHLTTTVCVLLIYGMLLISRLTGSSLFFYGISLLSVAIFALYVWSIRTMSSDENISDDSADVNPLTVKQVLLRFAFFSVLLVITSIAITYASDYLAVELSLGTTVAGALLLGIATSLPELISSFVLARLGNFNAVVGNIVGSNLFNFAILSLADIVYWNKELYRFDMQGSILIYFGLLANLAVFAIVCLINRANGKLTAKRAVPVLLGSCIPVVSYIAFVACSFA